MTILRLHGVKCCLLVSFWATVGIDSVFAEPSTLQETSLDAVSFDELLLSSRPLGDISLFEAQSAALWTKYHDTVALDKPRFEAHQARKIQDGDKSMRFSFNVKGEKPAQGYPLYIALHGGGSAPASLNDSQWQQMKTYYLDGVKSGIYTATRGVTDTWNLHFVDESYRLYDSLIENMIAFENVDPNRVYILGFSAGGDGVYQVTPRMPDRFAAANMSAGHHNWIKFDNLYQTPFLMQVGENDSAYKRNTVAVENSIELNRLQSLRGSYIHDAFVHYQGSHNSWSDRDGSGRPQTILADPIDWLKNHNETTTTKDTNAIHWLDQYSRNPYSKKLIWDPNTNAPRSKNMGAAYVQNDELKIALAQPRTLYYWLDISHAKALPEKITIEASYDTETNAVQLNSLGSLDQIRILVHPQMLDFNKDISVSVDGAAIGAIKLTADLRIMTRTLLERGDINYVFPAEINLVHGLDGSWSIQN